MRFTIETINTVMFYLPWQHHQRTKWKDYFNYSKLINQQMKNNAETLLYSIQPFIDSTRNGKHALVSKNK